MKNIDGIELGRIIRQRRKELGLTLSDLASERISVPTISNIERGIVQNASSDKVRYVMNALRLDEDTLKERMSPGKDAKREIESTLSLIEQLIASGLCERAEKLICQLERNEVAVEDEGLKIRINLAYASLLCRQLEWKKAYAQLTDVISDVEEYGTSPGLNVMTLAYNRLSACAFYGDNDFMQAVNYADKALEVFDPEGFRPYLKGDAIFNKSIYLFHAGKDASAYHCLLQLKGLCEQYYDMQTIVSAYNLEGIILRRQGVYEQALDAFRQGIDLCHNDNDLASRLYLNMGYAYATMRRWKDSELCFCIVHDLCKLTGNKERRALAYVACGEMYFHQKVYDRAKECLEKAHEFQRYLTTPRDYLHLLVFKARMELHSGKSNVETCEIGLGLADTHDLHDQAKDLHFLLSQYYDKIGDKDKCLDAMKGIMLVETMSRGGL